MDALHARDVGLKAASDSEIWAYASQSGGVVVSKDSDFLRLLRTRGRARLVHVTIGNCSNAVLIERFQTQWPAAMDALRTGELLVVLR